MTRRQQTRVDDARFRRVEEMIASLTSDAAMVGTLVTEFQIRPRAARHAIAVVRAALVEASTKDLQERRAEILHALEGIFGKAMEHAPEPHLKTALQALDQISRLLGLDAPQKIAVMDGIDFAHDGVITTAEIAKRLEALRARIPDGDKTN